MTALPPKLQTRKADVGDKVTFCLDAKGMSSYWAHVGHTAKITDIELKYALHRPGPTRAVYLVDCECGLKLKPRASHFEVLGV